MASQLRLQAQINDLVRIRHFVRQAALELGASRKAADNLELAVDELASNIVQHGYGGGAGPIEVDVERAGDELRVRLRDQAPPFDPTHLPAPNLNVPLEERPIGGMGVYLARQVVDEMQYRRLAEGGNEVTLVKRIARDHQGRLV